MNGLRFSKRKWDSSIGVRVRIEIGAFKDKETVLFQKYIFLIRLFSLSFYDTKPCKLTLYIYINVWLISETNLEVIRRIEKKSYIVRECTTV